MPQSIIVTTSGLYVVSSYSLFDVALLLHLPAVEPVEQQQEATTQRCYWKQSDMGFVPGPDRPVLDEHMAISHWLKKCTSIISLRSLNFKIYLER